MIGGTSRADDDCRLFMVVAGEEDDWDVEVEGDEEVEPLGVSSGVLDSVVLLSPSVAAVLLVASEFRDTPSRPSISSCRRPFDSKNDTLRSSGASRKDSSSKNLVACCRRSDREVSSELGGDAEAELVADGCCH